MRKMRALALIILAYMPILSNSPTYAEEYRVANDAMTAFDPNNEGMGQDPLDTVGVLVLAFSDTLVSLSKQGIDELQNSGAFAMVGDAAIFAWKRIPNTDELLYDVGLGTLIEMFLAGLGIDFSKVGPAQKAVIRDLSKTIAVFGKTAKSVEVGSTGLKFDSANIISQVIKPSSKFGVIYLFQRASGSENLSKKGIDIANYVGDALSRIFLTLGNERQLANSTQQSLYEFARDNFEPSWVVLAVFEVSLKNWVTNQISDHIASFMLAKKMTETVYAVANLLPLQSFKLNLKDGVLKNGANVHNGGLSPVFAYPAAFLVSYVAVAATQLMYTYLLTPPARISMDLIKAMWKSSYVQEPWNQVYVFVFPSPENSTLIKDEL